MGKLDFSGLADVLMSKWNEFLPQWSPGGKMVGREYTAGSINGGPGNSFKFNIETGKWSDFATGQKGADLISLYAQIYNLKNGEAAKKLADQINYNLSNLPFNQPPIRKNNYNITLPPQGVELPKMLHPSYGMPSASYCYKQPNGEPAFFEARYDKIDGKEIVPWSWDATNGRWVAKGFPEPRPIYGLDELYERPESPVMIVEGPKCAEAARTLAGGVYVPVTWTGGANGVSKSDWQPLFNRKVLIWPDADEPGIKAAKQLSDILLPIAEEIKVLDVKDMPTAWDVADAHAEGWDWNRLKDWAKPRANVIEVKTVAHVNGNGNGHAIAMTQVNIHTDDTPEQERAISVILEELGIAVNKHGKPACNMDNALRILERVDKFKDFAWFDTFHQKIFTVWNGPQREWTDRDTLELTKHLQRDYGFSTLSDATAYHALTLFAHAHPRNEPRDWMETLVWDGNERIDSFFIDCLGSDDTAYSRAASHNFWVGMVARIFNPGCKMDNMVVLEGPQGAMKSTALQRIGMKWFTETNESVTNKDFFQIIQGVLLVEIAELHTFSKSEVTRIKQVITCQNDRYRASYERLVANHPRQCIFVGSTNEDSYLRDTTGNRRFWPVRCGIIQPDLITASRDQLFAEAVAKFKQGSKWWEMPKEETEYEQENRRQADEWEMMIYAYLENGLSGMKIEECTLSQIAVDCLKFDPSRLDKLSQQRMSLILRKLGWLPFRNGINRTWKRSLN